jgi:hypothetical protein
MFRPRLEKPGPASLWVAWSIIFFAPLAATAGGPDWRPPDHVAGPFNGHYYELVPADGAATWVQARDMAEARIREGLIGYLATITTAEEYDFLLNAFPELQYRDVWIGASDLKYPGRFFQWITGESGNYAIGSAGSFEKWSPGEPGLEAAENCVVISVGSGGWLDRSCDSTHTYFLVEYSTQIVNAIKAWGGAGIGNRFPDPEVFAFTVEVGVTDEYYNQRLSPLFASHVVPLPDIPRYFIASAATEPNFDAFLANASVPGFYVYFENTTFNSSLEQVTHGSGSGRITSVDYRNVPVDHIELLIGDETRSEYDPQRGFLRFWWDYTLTFYGPVLRDQNHTVTFQPDASTYTFTPDTRGCPAGYVGKFSFEAQLAYLGQTRLSNLRAYIVHLTGGNLILATTGVALDAGKSMPVPASDGYTDQLLAPGEYVDMRFNVCLKSTRPFQLYIDVLGHEWAEN